MPAKQKYTASDQGVVAKKHYGQHFLTDLEIAKKIADLIDAETTDNLLEIGPGTGVLTQYLWDKSKRLILVELDVESVLFLEQQFLPRLLKENSKTIKILQADFLKLDLAPLFENAPFKLIGNFPYNISSQIVFKMLEHRQRVPQFCGMFQKEVAERICAKHGSKVYGILSVLCQAYYHCDYKFSVSPSAFNPPPKVESGVINLTRKHQEIEGLPYLFFKRVVKTAFQQRRKTLRNALKPVIGNSNFEASTFLSLRAEQLSIEDFIELSHNLYLHLQPKSDQ
ncbi:MAG: 16S rRNA (adenine(1518)-N(6)/adenine(1519)-N(6))-dimethyltransferase RsmA [Flavobacteriaceae bacterium]|nr:16S rRNA (adenine(1518)-N(6)/adenine(1519)-N(6))-dimethyltransferase RsmA [Flavobacteriaceae bacterium]